MVQQQTDNRHPPHIGDVYMVELTSSGSVQSGFRPCVVFQNDIGNAHSPNVVVIPLTTNLKKRDMPTHVVIRASDTGLAKDSMALCENPQCIPKDRLGRYITRVPDTYMARIAAASIMASGAIAYMDLETVIRAWQQASVMRAAS